LASVNFRPVGGGDCGAAVTTAMAVNMMARMSFIMPRWCDAHRRRLKRVAADRVKRAAIGTRGAAAAAILTLSCGHIGTGEQP
jgi:hypothetical protein